jgi:hypothetical protein
MAHLLSTLSIATGFLALTPVYAADCKNYDAKMRGYLSVRESDLWALRQQACGDGKCGSQQVCTLRINSRYGSASLYRKDVQYNYANCWVRSAFVIDYYGA